MAQKQMMKSFVYHTKLFTFWKKNCSAFGDLEELNLVNEKILMLEHVVEEIKPYVDLRIFEALPFQYFTFITEKCIAKASVRKATTFRQTDRRNHSCVEENQKSFE